MQANRWDGKSTSIAISELWGLARSLLHVYFPFMSETHVMCANAHVKLGGMIPGFAS